MGSVGSFGGERMVDRRKETSGARSRSKLVEPILSDSGTILAVRGFSLWL